MVSGLVQHTGQRMSAAPRRGAGTATQCDSWTGQRWRCRHPGQSGGLPATAQPGVWSGVPIVPVGGPGAAWAAAPCSIAPSAGIAARNDEQSLLRTVLIYRKPGMCCSGMPILRRISCSARFACAASRWCSSNRATPSLNHFRRGQRLGARDNLLFEWEKTRSQTGLRMTPNNTRRHQSPCRAGTRHWWQDSGDHVVVPPQTPKADLKARTVSAGTSNSTFVISRPPSAWKY